MAGWADIRESLENWHQKRSEAVLEQHQLHAQKLKDDIVEELNKGAKSSQMKKVPLAPSDTQKDGKNPLDGLAEYTSSVIIEQDGDGLDTVHEIKIDNPTKKDETSGMMLGKIAKAVEFGTRQIAPRPAWRRALNKMKATGIYKKET